ncbi:MAG TPA: hypothetical protein VF268_15385 [Gammaproteobacteria bacterium]
MLGLKATLITGAAGLMAALVLGFLWKSEQAKSARLEGELSQALANTEVLKTAVEDQKAAFEKMAALVNGNSERVQELMQERDHANGETARARAEIDSLRAAEANRALQAPFGRGNFARERFTHSLQRIAGTAGGAGEDSHDPNITASSHSD